MRNSSGRLSHWGDTFIDFQLHLGVFQISCSHEQLAVFSEDCVNLRVLMLYRDIVEIDAQKIKCC